MDFLFQTALSYRMQLVNLVEDLEDELLDEVPKGFRNNIRWNLAHLVVTPHLLTYGLLQQANPLLSPEFARSAAKGTNHENFSLNEDYGKKHLLEFIVEIVKQLQRDFKDLSKHKFKPYETSTGLVLKDLVTAISYSNIHDGIHIGTVSSMLKVLNADKT